MDINEYRNKGRMRIELPSGLAGNFRLPSIMDLAAYPQLMGHNGNGGPQEGGEVRDMYHCILRRCFIPDGGTMTDKEPGKCLPGELSIHELAPEDTAAIIEAVTTQENKEGSPGGEARFPAEAD